MSILELKILKVSSLETGNTTRGELVEESVWRVLKIVLIATLVVVLGCTGAFLGLGWLYRVAYTEYNTVYAFDDCQVIEERFSAGGWDSTHQIYHLKCTNSRSRIILQGSSIDAITWDSSSASILDTYYGREDITPKANEYQLGSGEILTIRYNPAIKPN